MKRARWLFLPVGLIMAYLGAAIVGALVPGPVANLPDAPIEVEIRLVSGPIHYDILLPLDAPTRARFAFLENSPLPLDHPQAEWLMVGWGARTFYTTTGSYRDVMARAVLRGIFGDDSVMRVDVLPHLNDDLPFPRLSLSLAEYDALMDAIALSFSRDIAGQVDLLDHPGFNDTDQFFNAERRFHIFRTCNTWVGQMLRAGGQRIGIWTPTPYAVDLSRALYAD